MHVPLRHVPIDSDTNRRQDFDAGQQKLTRNFNQLAADTLAAMVGHYIDFIYLGRVSRHRRM